MGMMFFLRLPFVNTFFVKIKTAYKKYA